MKAKAIYIQEEHEGGRITHNIDHDGGGFVLSSERVAVSVQNFLNFATPSDMSILHSHLLHAYGREMVELEKLPISDPVFQYNREDDDNGS